MTRRRLRWLAGGAALAVAALAAAWQFDPGRIGRRLASALPFGGAAQSCFQGAVHYCLAAQSRSGKIEFPAKTDYWNGVPKLDAEGVIRYVDLKEERLLKAVRELLNEEKRSQTGGV